MTDHRPLTVIVPMFNGARYLEQTLTSLNRQSQRAFDVICVDDGSHDDSLALARNHPLKPRVLEQPNNGVAVARNHGAMEARTKYITFLDQDDLWHERRAEQLTNFLRSRPECRVVATTEQAFALESERSALYAISPTLGEWPAVYLKSGETRLLLGDSSPLNPNGSGQVKALTTEDILNGPISVTTSIVYERDIYHLAGGCAPWAKAMDDYILLVSASKITPIFHLDRPSAYYRVHASSTSRVTQLALPFLSAGFALRVSTNEHLTHPQFQNAPMYRQCFTELIQTGTAEDAKSVIALSMLLLDMRERRSIFGSLARQFIKQNVPGTKTVVGILRSLKSQNNNLH